MILHRTSKLVPMIQNFRFSPCSPFGSCAIFLLLFASVQVIAASNIKTFPAMPKSDARAAQSSIGEKVTKSIDADGVSYATVQAALSALPASGGTLHIPPGIYSSTSAIGVTASNVRIICDGGMRNTVIEYTGRTLVPAVIDVGTRAPTTSFVEDFYIEGCTVRSAGNAVSAIRLQGVHRSFLKNIDARDVIGSGILWRFGVGNVLMNIHCSSQDGVFTTQPKRCLDLEEIDATHQFTTSAIITPVVEGLSGAGIYMQGAQTNSVSDAQVSINGTGLDLEPGKGGSFFNVFSSNLFESSSSGTDVVVNSSFNVFENDQATVKAEIKSEANNNTFEGGQYAALQIDSGAVATHLKQIQTTLATLSDRGTDTIYDNVWDFGKQRQFLRPVFKQTNPAYTPGSGLVGGGGYDPVDVVRGVWDIGKSGVVLSPTTLTIGKPWRAVFIGLWENNVDGAALLQQAPYIEVTSASPTLALGSVSLTFSVNGSGLFQAVSSSNNASFSGTIFILPSPKTESGTQSINVSGSISGGTYKTRGNCSSKDSPAVCGGAAAGSVVVAAGATSVVVQTTSVTANSQIILTFDSSLGTRLGTACNTIFDQAYVTARMPAASFTITASARPTGNPACYSYEIIN